MLSRVRKCSLTTEYDTYNLEDDDNEMIQLMVEKKKQKGLEGPNGNDYTYSYDPFFDVRDQTVTRYGITVESIYDLHIIIVTDDKKERKITLKINMNGPYLRYHHADSYNIETTLFNVKNNYHLLYSLFNLPFEIIDHRKPSQSDPFLITAKVKALKFKISYKGEIFYFKEGDKISTITKNKGLYFLKGEGYNQLPLLIFDSEDEISRIYKNLINIDKLPCGVEDFLSGINVLLIVNYNEFVDAGRLYPLITRKYSSLYISYDYDVSPLGQLFLYSKYGNNVDLILKNRKLTDQLFPGNISYEKMINDLCLYYSCRRIHLFSQLYTIDVMNKNTDRYINTLDNDYKQLFGKIKSHDHVLLSILSVVFFDSYDLNIHVNLYLNLLYYITDQYRKTTNILYETIVEWYENEKHHDSINWEALAKKVCFYCPFKNINGNYKAINLLLMSLKHSGHYLERPSNFSFDRAVNIFFEDPSEIHALLGASDIELLSLFNKKQKSELDRNLLMSFNSSIITAIKDMLDSFRADIKMWSIYRKNKCDNDDILNILSGELHRDDDKSGKILSYGYSKYDCYPVDELFDTWKSPNILREKGFVNPDFIDEENSKHLGLRMPLNNKEKFSLKDMKDLLKYLREDIEEKDKPDYEEFAKFIEENIDYADDLSIMMGNNKKITLSIDRDILLDFFSMILTMIMKVRYWGVFEDWEIPYTKIKIDQNDLSDQKSEIRSDNARNFFIDVFYPWMLEKDEKTLFSLMSLVNIKPVYKKDVDTKKYITMGYDVDKRSDTTLVAKNLLDLSKFFDSIKKNENPKACSLIEYKPQEDSYRVNKNTLFGRILHGLYHPVACFGVTGDLLIDNIRIYNSLFLRYNLEEYNQQLTSRIKKIVPNVISENLIIDIDMFQFTHGDLFVRNNTFLEDSY
jgi:hypothetical protein